MHNIDLTLRKDLLKKSTRRDLYDDTNRYLDKLGYSDQHRSMNDILGYNKFKLKILKTIYEKGHSEFFTKDTRFKCSELEINENIFRITGLLTSFLKMEYEAGFGTENRCDCCGQFRSNIFNSDTYSLCNKCDRSNDSEFWERR